MNITTNLEPISNDEPCKWQDKECYCWFEMPDSKLKCKGKCQFYEYDGSYIGKD